MGDNSDAFPNDSSEWVDTDGDGVGDNSDAFPNNSSEWVDTDGDGVGDNSDVFPYDSSEWVDTDGDGVGDNSDMFPNDSLNWNDTDGDGVGDNSDVFPYDSSEWVDTDGDGVGDNSDMFPNDSLNWNDTDGDGVGDGSDAFPLDPAASKDTDGDGYPDNWNNASNVSYNTSLHLDAFPNDPKEWNDTDGDGVGDNSDMLPTIAAISLKKQDVGFVYAILGLVIALILIMLYRKIRIDMLPQSVAILAPSGHGKTSLIVSLVHYLDNIAGEGRAVYSYRIQRGKDIIESVLGTLRKGGTVAPTARGVHEIIDIDIVRSGFPQKRRNLYMNDVSGSDIENYFKGDFNRAIPEELLFVRNASKYLLVIDKTKLDRHEDGVELDFLYRDLVDNVIQDMPLRIIFTHIDSMEVRGSFNPKEYLKERMPSFYASLIHWKHNAVIFRSGLYYDRTQSKFHIVGDHPQIIDWIFRSDGMKAAKRSSAFRQKQSFQRLDTKEPKGDYSSEPEPEIANNIDMDTPPPSVEFEEEEEPSMPIENEEDYETSF